MLKPFGGSGTDTVSYGDRFLFDGFQDTKIQARDGASEHDVITPPMGGGQYAQGMTRPEWRVVSGDVSTVGYNTQHGYSGRVVTGTTNEVHEMATFSPVVSGQWYFSARFQEKSSSGEAWSVDLMHDPATGEAWRVLGTDSFEMHVQKVFKDGTVHDRYVGDWAFSWSGLYVFVEAVIDRDPTGRWTVTTQARGKLADFSDPWLPTNPREFRWGSRPYNGGVNNTVKETSMIRIDLDPSDPANYQS